MRYLLLLIIGIVGLSIYEDGEIYLEELDSEEGYVVLAEKDSRGEITNLIIKEEE